MKFRNQFFKYQIHCEDGDNGNAGGGGNDGNQDANANANSDGNQNANNNNNNNVDDYTQLWDNPDTDGDANNNDQQQQNNNNQQPPSAEEVFNQHVDGLNFGANAESFAAAMRSDDPEQQQTAIKELQSQVYKSAMLDVNKVINQRVDAAIAEVRNETNSTIQSNTMIAQMEKALPFTKSPAYAPMAKAVLTRFLGQKDITPEKAIAKTGEYFQKFAGEVHAGLQKPPNNKGRGGFNNANANHVQIDGQSDGEEMDWVGFITGESPN